MNKRDLKGYEGLYFATEDGNIFSHERLIIIPRNGAAYLKNEHLVKPNKGKKGYLLVTLCKNGKKTTHSIHRLIAKSFIENLENKPQVNHKNGIKDDNNIKNLEWCSRSENILHAYKTGLLRSPKGVDHKLSKLNDYKVRQIRKMLNTGISQLEIGKKFKIEQSTISRIKNNKRWKHVV
jgi:hypothetical protein